MSSDLQAQLQEIVGDSYRIERELGGAGMSRVFVATDTELDRQVVIKVLPPELAAGINTDRFRREIQLAARLQHPHIVPLHAAGARGSLLYYTMPFIVGENLRTRLNKSGDLPVQEATKILREVADALSYAHGHGVVHRDIKPENVLLSGNHALVTDFGVSKALSNATAETPADAPSLTSLGIALGTPAYMAPEQAAADPNVDARADIYALGIVGYELLTGRPPFAGLNQQQTLAAHITTAAAPITQHRPQLPAGLGAVIMRCIEKRPSDRFQSADELHTALEPYATTSGATAPSQAQPAKAPFKWTPQRIAVAAGILGIVATGLVASTIAFRRNGQSFVVGNTRQITNAAGLEVLPSVSPDGRLVAYSVSNGPSYSLFVRQVSGGRAIMLADSAGFASWKPDGSEILFSRRGGRNFTVPALGGVATEVSGLDGLGACMYSNAGDKVACTEASGSLVIADANGENRRRVPGTASSDGVMLPSWSADDRLIAYSRGNTAFFIGENIGNLAPSSILVVRAAGEGKPMLITDRTHLNVSPVWTTDGSVVFVSSLGGTRDIYIQRLGGDLSPRGAPVRLTTGLNAHTISIDRSSNTLAYSVFSTVANVWSTPITSADPEHPVIRQVTSGNQTIESMSTSPDGKWIAFDSNINGNQDIFKMPVAGGDAQQLTHNGANNFSPVWSPDGTQITFHSLVKGNRDIYVMSAAGGNADAVVATPSEEWTPYFLPDGKGLAYVVLPDSNFEIMRDPSRPGGWSAPKFRIRAPLIAYSPDGKEILVAALDDICPDCPTGFYLLSSSWTNRRPVAFPEVKNVLESPGTALWSRDSKHAFFMIRETDGTSSIWQVPVNGDRARRAVHFTDPLRQVYRTNLDLDQTNFYFNIGDRQSDIWTMELRKQ